MKVKYTRETHSCDSIHERDFRDWLVIVVICINFWFVFGNQIFFKTSIILNKEHKHAHT